MIKQLTANQTSVAYRPTSAEDYQKAVTFMTNSGFKHLGAKGYKSDEFIGYCPSLAQGEKAFSEGMLPESLLEDVLFVDTVQDLLETAEDLVENYDESVGASTRERIERQMFELQMRDLMEVLGR